MAQKRSHQHQEKARMLHEAKVRMLSASAALLALSAFTYLTVVWLLCPATNTPISWSSAHSGAHSGAERIAIIGAGAGGSSCAYYLQKYTSFGYNVTVFDKASYVGGRSTTVHPQNLSTAVELGASIFTDANSIMMSAAEEFGLARVSFGTTDEFMIWNGAKALYTYKQEALPYLAQLKLVLRYGKSIFRTSSLVAATLKQFLGYFYSSAFPYASLTEIASGSGLDSLSGTRASDYFSTEGVSSLYQREIIEAVTRVNYAQNVDQIHALGASVVLSAGSAYSILGGNWQVFEGFLKAAEANVLLEHSVTKIARNKNTYGLTVSGPDGRVFEEEFDQVVIAAPFDPSLESEYASRIVPADYVELHVTLLTTFGSLSSDYFGTDYVPSTVITSTQQAQGDIPFFSISRIANVSETGESVYKVFSPAEISDELLSELFTEEISWLHRKTWHSYPYLTPTTEFTDLQLDLGLWYLNGMEKFISTMETSALAGANVAALISQGKNTTSLTIP